MKSSFSLFSLVLVLLAQASAFVLPASRSFSRAFPQPGRAKVEATDAEVVSAVEVAFQEISSEEKSSREDRKPSDSEANDEIKRKVAAALGVDEDGFEASSSTLRQISEISAQASLAFIKARDYLEYATVYVQDRAERDAALLKAVVGYVQERTVYDTRRLLAAAADTAKPLLQLVEALNDTTSEKGKRSNLTLSEGLLLLQSGVSPLQKRRLATFEFNDDEEARLEAAKKRMLLAGGAAPKLKTGALPAGSTAASAAAGVAKVAASLPGSAVSAAAAADDVVYRAGRKVAAQPAGSFSRQAASKLPPALRDSVLGALDDAQAKANSLNKLPQASQDASQAAQPQEKPRTLNAATADAKATAAQAKFAAARAAAGAEAAAAQAAREEWRRVRDATAALILDRELSGITATAAATVAATEKASELETLERLEVALGRTKPLALAWKANATQAAATVVGVGEVLKGTSSPAIRLGLEKSFDEAKAVVLTSKLLEDLRLKLDKESKLAHRRSRSTAEVAARASQLASRVAAALAKSSAPTRQGGDKGDKELRALSLAARQVIPSVDEQTKTNLSGREQLAFAVGGLRAELAASLDKCQALVENAEAAKVVQMLVDVAKLETVISMADEVATSASRVREYTRQVGKLDEIDARADSNDWIAQADLELLKKAVATETSVVETSVAEASVVETSVAEASVIETSIAEASVVETSVAEASVVETSVVEAGASKADPLKKAARTGQAAPQVEVVGVVEVEKSKVRANKAPEAGVAAREADKAEEWGTLSTTLTGLGITVMGEKDEKVIDLEESDVNVEAAKKEIQWGNVLLRLLDIGLFVTEEMVKVIAPKLPLLGEAVTTALERSVNALGDGTKPLGSGTKRPALKSLQRPEDKDDKRPRSLLGGGKARKPAAVEEKVLPTGSGRR